MPGYFVHTFSVTDCFESDSAIHTHEFSFINSPVTT
ncbi:MAG: hypothetical protein JWM26_758 [Betaproteobacteria bacterium]|nr:hypothetical protein [Betaproteobacteria bacterium]